MEDQDRIGLEPDSSSDALVEDLLCELLELPGVARDAALDRLCILHPGSAGTLRRRLSLLQTHLPARDQAGTPHFGRFELLGRLGGGMAEVYLAFDPDRDERVVLKILRHAEFTDGAAQASLAREAGAASRLQHPCIAPVLEFGCIDDVPFLVRAFRPGQTLAEWVQERRSRHGWSRAADLPLLLDWFEQIARALHAAHQVGLVHRDVKPANILVPFQGSPQLLDFGICQDRAVEPGLAPCPTAGSPAYMAPEQFEVRSLPLGPAVDIHAVGVSLFECATGSLPYHGTHRQDLCRAILLQPPPDPRRSSPELPRDLTRVLAAAMAKQAWDRYPDAAALADDLARLRRGQPVQAPQVSWSERLRRWIRRSPRRAIAVGVAAMLLTAAPVLEVMACADEVADLDLFAIPAQVAVARDTARLLVPGRPEQVPALAEWLHARGEPLARLQPRLHARLAELVGRPDVDTTELATLRRADQLLNGFLEPEQGMLTKVQERLAWATQVRRRTDEQSAAWQRAAAEVAADPRFQGLRLLPQHDLEPLGQDPRSGLWEFHHARTSSTRLPVHRDEHTGNLILPEGHGLVFVLVPPGRFTMGQQSADPAAPRYCMDDPNAHYWPAHQVTLDGFLISKFEMTQAQWHRLTGRWPAYQRRDSRYGNDPPTGFQQPVESVSALECDEVLREVGLLLPTEAQWEYAAGAGAGAPGAWFFGNDVTAMRRFGNTRDRRFQAVSPHVPTLSGFDDGWAGPAPIGQFEPNPFGLHDVYGNVAEWCRDYWHGYDDCAPAPGTGLRHQSREQGERVHRGGGYQHLANEHCTTSRRSSNYPDLRLYFLGLRPARLLDEELH